MRPEKRAGKEVENMGMDTTTGQISEFLSQEALGQATGVFGKKLTKLGNESLDSPKKEG